MTEFNILYDKSDKNNRNDGFEFLIMLYLPYLNHNDFNYDYINYKRT